MKKLIQVGLAIVVVALAGCGQKSEQTGAKTEEKKGYTIAVIPKGTTHEFWKSIHGGAVKAEQELTAVGTPVEVILKGPLREDDRDQQIQVVETLQPGAGAGIVVAPLDPQALVNEAQTAVQSGIPVVVMDSGVEDGQIHRVLSCGRII